MGRKDSAHAPSLPIDNYRKQIGRYDQKKEKRGPDQRRRLEKEARSSAMTIKDVVLLLAAILGMLICAYYVFYIYLVPPLPVQPSP